MVADQGVEPSDVGIALKDTPGLSEEGLVGLLSEEAGGHWVAFRSGAPGNRWGFGDAGCAGVKAVLFPRGCEEPAWAVKADLEMKPEDRGSWGGGIYDSLHARATG